MRAGLLVAQRPSRAPMLPTMAPQLPAPIAGTDPEGDRSSRRSVISARSGRRSSRDRRVPRSAARLDLQPVGVDAAVRSSVPAGQAMRGDGRRRAERSSPTSNQNEFGRHGRRRDAVERPVRRRHPAGARWLRPCAGRTCRVARSRALRATGSFAQRSGRPRRRGRRSPVTWGAAIDVPSSQPQPGAGYGSTSAGSALRIADAGRGDVDGLRAVVRERRRGPPLLSIAATEMMFGQVERRPGRAGRRVRVVVDAVVAGGGHEEHPGRRDRVVQVGANRQARPRPPHEALAMWTPNDFA